MAKKQKKCPCVRWTEKRLTETINEMMDLVYLRSDKNINIAKQLVLILAKELNRQHQRMELQ